MTALASFEDFLYIVIGILWIAFSFYNAKKKKDAKKNASAPANKQKSILESLLDEVGYNNEQDDPVLYKQETDQIEVDLATPKTEEPAEVFSYDDYYEESNSKSINGVIEKERLTPAIKKDKDYSKINKNTRNKKIKNRINLRKAVIYSEIINKVYF